MKLLKNMIDLSYGISEKLGEASVKGEIVDVTMCLILQQLLTEDARNFQRGECVDVQEICGFASNVQGGDC
jgi:hypothetical protein